MALIWLYVKLFGNMQTSKQWRNQDLILVGSPYFFLTEEQWFNQ
jgi:hypothetical protein